MTVKNLQWRLMQNNILREDLNAVIRFLKKIPRLTQSNQVRRFEEAWSDWIGVKYSVFVNSGSSANLITLAALRELVGTGEVIVPTLTWVSDIAAVLHCGFKPVFVDINPRTFGMDSGEIIRKIGPKTKAVFLTHILGYNALSRKLLTVLKQRAIPLIEDACESHGAVFEGKKAGAWGYASNFSFYYAHHLSTIEGGMVCTNDPVFYQTVRMFRAHGLVREATDLRMRSRYAKARPDLDPEFIFAFPAYNVRSTEINAVLGLSQLKRLDENIRKRNRNFKIFLENLDSEKYITDFETRGCSNYAFTLILQPGAKNLAGKVAETLKRYGIEFRRGTSGGGNQLRQPYLRKLFKDAYKKFPNTEHVHFCGFYIGNYPDLKPEKIKALCRLLNVVE